MARTTPGDRAIPDPDSPNDLTARAAAVTLDPDELRRYGRHLVLPEVGEAGQKRLRAARVLLVGAGGLGSPAALYLAAAGVGTIELVDDDRVEVSNLQRQVLFGSADAGRPKTEAARERLADLNPGIEIVEHRERLTEENALDLVRGRDLVVDGSDNFPTRYLVNDACVLSGVPLVWGAVQRFEGQVAVFATANGPCYRCLFPEPPPAGSVPTCAEAGVLGVLPGIVGTLQANEAIKLLLDRGEPLVGRFLSIDALTVHFRELRLDRDPQCPVCGDEPSIDRPRAVAAVCAPSEEDWREDLEETAEVAQLPLPDEISPVHLAEWLAEDLSVQLLDVREDWEIRLCRIGEPTTIPLRQLPERLGEVGQRDITVVYCHHGGRSEAAVRFLRDRGYDRVTNLAGGIDAWSREIDPDVPRY